MMNLLIILVLLTLLMDGFATTIETAICYTWGLERCVHDSPPTINAKE